MCGYSYALTALMVHYFEDPHPAWMDNIDTEKISAPTKETIEMV